MCVARRYNTTTLRYMAGTGGTLWYCGFRHPYRPMMAGTGTLWYCGSPLPTDDGRYWYTMVLCLTLFVDQSESRSSCCGGALAIGSGPRTHTRQGLGGFTQTGPVLLGHSPHYTALTRLFGSLSPLHGDNPVLLGHSPHCTAISQFFWVTLPITWRYVRVWLALLGRRGVCLPELVAQSPQARPWYALGAVGKNNKARP